MRPTRQRGQATVELAILMIVLVPVFLYVLFLEDLLRHRLMAQAAVVTTPWDFHGISYEAFDRNTQVDTRLLDKATVTAGRTQTVGGHTGRAPGLFARLTWCDHTAAYNSYDPNFECNDSGHHVALSAHACWDTELAQEVGCGIDSSTGANYTDPAQMITPFMGVAHKGGEIFCSARVGVLNYFLPQKVFSQFSQVDTTRTTKLSGDVHGHRGAAASSVYALTMQRFSVLHDPWAQTTVQNVSAPGSGVLQRRVNAIYWSPMSYAAYGAAMIYLGQAVRDQLISPAALAPLDTFISDDLTSANVAYDTRDAARSRGHFYMGLRVEPR
jgi:hypothetical protein